MTAIRLCRCVSGEEFFSAGSIIEYTEPQPMTRLRAYSMGHLHCAYSLKARILAVVSFLFALPTVISISCGTSYRQKCTVAIGSALTLDNDNPSVLQPNVPSYLSFMVPSNHQNLAISISSVISSPIIYLAINREPKLTDYDLTSKFSANVDFLDLSSLIEANKIKDGDSCEIMLFSEYEESHFVAMTVYAGNRLVNLPYGVPLRYDLNKVRKTIKFEHYALSTNLTSIIATNLAGQSKQIVVVVAHSVTHRTWVSDSNNSYPGVSFAALETELSDPFEITVSLRPNTVDNGVVSFSITSFLGNELYPVYLLDGMLQFSTLSLGAEQYFKWSVPKRSEGVEIGCYTITGDADIFINKCSSGFYHKSKNISVPAYSSQKKIGRDLVIIPQTDLLDRTNLCITTYGYKATSYILRSVTGSTVRTLIESFPLFDSHIPGVYRYYRFIDSNPSEEIRFDVLPLSGGESNLFVSCKLLATGDMYGYPSKLSGHHNYSSTLRGENTIAISPKDKDSCSYGIDPVTQTSVFYLSVVGFSRNGLTDDDNVNPPSTIDYTYALMAMHYEGIQTLTDGLPLEGKIFKHEVSKFRFRMGEQSESLTVTVTPGDGDVDLFIALRVTDYWYDYDYKSTSAGNSIDSITIPESEVCRDCWVSIFVVSYQSTRFSIVAHLKDTLVTMPNGVPLKGSVSNSQCQFYSYRPIFNGSTEAVLTILSGSANLYMSKTNPKPCFDTFVSSLDMQMSGYYGGVYPHTILSHTETGDTVYIGVGGVNNNASYTLRVSEKSYNTFLLDNLYPLLIGVPQGDFIFDPDQPWNYYTIPMQAGHESASLRWSPIIGNVEVYVGKCDKSISSCFYENRFPNTTSYLLSSKNTASHSLDIKRNDPTAVTYIIGVIAKADIAAYQISYSTESSTLELSPGIAVVDHVFQKETDYFSFFLSTNKKIRISLTTLGGDPDLFVSTKAKHPSYTNSTWRALSYGDDEIIIDPSLDSAACVNCRYYIAVNGLAAKESTYSLALYLEFITPSLIDGIPSSGSVSQLDWTYYTFIVPRGVPVDIRIDVSTLSGNCDLYVSVNGLNPSWSNHQFESTNAGTADDSVIIKHDDPNLDVCFRVGERFYGCVLIIGLNSVSDSDFTITATTSVFSRLIVQDVPYTSTVNADEYQFYVMPFYFNRTASTFRLYVSVNSGSAAVYLSCSSSPRKENHQWIFIPNSIERDFVLPSLSSSEAQLCFAANNMHVSVYGISAAHFTIMSTTEKSIPTLQPGVPLSGSVAPHAIQGYFIRAGHRNEAISVNAVVFSGDISVFLSLDYDNRAVYNRDTGLVENFLVSVSSAGQSSLILTYSSNEIATACQDRATCYFVFSVYGTHTSASSYSVTYSIVDSTATLTDGVPVRGTVSKNAFQYYKYALTEQYADLVLIATPFSGDCDLFVSVDRRPGHWHNSTWQSSRFGADVITIQTSDIAKYCLWSATRQVCNFFIGVYGFSNSSYSLVATASRGFVSRTILADGQPQSGHVDQSRYFYYEFAISMKTSILSPITLTLTSLTGDSDLYVSFSGEPGVKSYDYKSTKTDNDVDQITITPSMDHFCEHCTLYIAVYGYTASSYSLVASIGKVTELQTNVPNGGSVDTHSYKYFSYSNTDPSGKITVTLNPSSGDADLYISTYDTHSPNAVSFPTQSNNIWHSLRSGEDIITIGYTDLNYCYNCLFLIGVYGYSNCTFTVTVTENEDSIVRLIINRPQKMLVDVHSNFSTMRTTRYFSLVPPNSIDDIIISFTALSRGMADMYVQIFNGSLPTTQNGFQLPNPDDPNTFQYSTARSADVTLRVPAVTDYWYATLIIAVIPRSPSSSLVYSILASSSVSSVLLRAGVPQNHFVDKNSNAFFIYYPSDVEDLVVSVTARSGDPDLLISRHNPHPNCAIQSNLQTKCFNYTYAARRYSSDQIYLSKDFPCKATVPGTIISTDCNPKDRFSADPVYIGVFGYVASKFTITLTESGMIVQLSSGVPQLGKTAPGFECAKRDPISGACDASASSTPSQVAYFSYRVYPSSDESDSVVTFSIKMICDVSSATETCPTLSMFISSCALSKCTEVISHPSSIPGQNQLAIKGIRSDVASTAIVDPRNKLVYCDPNSAGEVCIYYIAVAATSQSSISSFSISARTPGSVTLLPCDLRPVDGFRSTTTDSIQGSSVHTYELCSYSSSTAEEFLMVSLEQCYGQTTLRLCSESDSCENAFPTPDSWSYSLTSDKFCVPDSKKRERCSDIPDTHAVTFPNILLPQSLGNFFMSANGEGTFNFHIQSTVKGATVTARLQPQVQSSTLSFPVSVVNVEGNIITLSWPSSSVLMPGDSIPISSDYVDYYVYAVDNAALVATDAVTSTPCGLSYLRDKLPTLTTELVVQANTRENNRGALQRKLKLRPSTSFSIFVYAVCDEDCLRQIAKVHGAGPCLIGCVRQFFMYDGTTATTDEALPEPASGGSTGSGTSMVVVASTIAVVAVLIVLITIGVYYRRATMLGSSSEDFKMTEMIDINNIFGSSARGPSSSSSGIISYEPALDSSQRAEDAAYQPPTLTSSVSSAAKNFNNMIRSKLSSASSLAESKASFTYSNLWAKGEATAPPEDEEVEISL